MAKKVVFILGSGHCGSTLLDLILSSHSQAFGLGELKRLAQSRDYFTFERPVCNLNGFEDDFWTPEVVREIQPFFRTDHSLPYRVLHRLFPGRSRDRYRFYQYLFRKTGAGVLVDSSKGSGWMQRLVRENRGDIEAYAILLKRDPRAVVSSYLRKNPRRGVEDIARHYRLQMDTLEKFFASYRGPKLLLTYEELATDAESVTRRLCEEFLEIPYEPQMLEFWRFDHHQISGNVGTKSLLRKFRLQQPSALLDQYPTNPAQREYYGQHTLAIRLDERWKEELSGDQIRMIDEVLSR